MEGEISIHGRNGQEISPENRCDSRNMFSRRKKAHFENKEEARQWNPALSEADRQVRRRIGQSQVRWIAIPSLSYHCEEEIDGAEPEYFVCGTIPLGLQHVLAMFVGNLTALLIITGTCGLAGGEFADLQLSLLQNAMLFAGIVTLVQLVFGGSGIVPTALVAILLNIILPKEKEA